MLIPPLGCTDVPMGRRASEEGLVTENGSALLPRGPEQDRRPCRWGFLSVTEVPETRQQERALRSTRAKRPTFIYI